MHLPTGSALVLHPRRDSTRPPRVLDWTRKQTRPCRVPGEVDRIGCDIEEVEPDQLPGLDLLISLGGDGTMLRTMRLYQPTGVPVLGVNLGPAGFLAEIDVADLPARAGRRSTPTASPSSPGRRCAADFAHDDRLAFNDVAAGPAPGPAGRPRSRSRSEGQPVRALRRRRDHRGHPDRLHRVQLLGRRPVVSPRVEGLLVVPAAAHSAFNRALLLPAAGSCSLELLPTSGQLAVEVDGIVVGTSSRATGARFRCPGAARWCASATHVLRTGPAQAAPGGSGRAGRGGRHEDRVTSTV